jgi:hypothetical protein
MDARYPKHLAGGSHDEKRAARLALVVRIYTVVGLLLSYELERLVLTISQWTGPKANQILAFVSEKDGGPVWD